MPYGEILDWHGLRLTTHPAGHILGSAMLRVDDGQQSLLYTGDFKLGPSATAEVANPPQADILVMESTFGERHYRLPPRDKVIADLLQVVRDALLREQTPVIQAYVLGKSQEVTKILTLAGFEVLQHPLVYEISQIYEAAGCDLGSYQLYDAAKVPGRVVVVPPASQRTSRLGGLRQAVTISVTGWAVNTRRGFAHRTDHSLPLSDHADYTGLLQCIELVAPRVIYCTHGPEAFVHDLRERGYDARPLDGRSLIKPLADRQRPLFDF
jgi:Cft2 family RNA processing exonuclease